MRLRLIRGVCAAIGIVAFGCPVLAHSPMPPTVADERPQARSARQALMCLRWRRVADRLGETFAGERLRRTVVAEACARSGLNETRRPGWTWPWRAGGLDPALPPHLHGRYGDWSIRCGGNGHGERCALINEASVNIEPLHGGATRIGLVSHVVIDAVGGEERLLWRVFVERPEASWFAIAPSAVPTPGHSAAVRLDLGGDVVEKAFDACSATGCMMESGLAAGSRIAARLGQGHPIGIAVATIPGLVLRQSMPAAGFREGLRELTNLKRREQTAVAGR